MVDIASVPEMRQANNQFILSRTTDSRMDTAFARQYRLPSEQSAHPHDSLVAMASSKRLKLMSAASVILPSDVIGKIMPSGLLQGSTHPWHAFPHVHAELQLQAQQYQERLHHYLDCFDPLPDQHGCTCEDLNATDFLLLCYSIL
jgi:hypothetical protein